jgi:hypothetical protein
MRSSGPCRRKFPVQSCVAARTAKRVLRRIPWHFHLWGERCHYLADHAVRHFAIDVAFEGEVG